MPLVDRFETMSNGEAQAATAVVRSFLKGEHALDELKILMEVQYSRKATNTVMH